MRLRLLALAGMAACSAFAGVVTFSGKTAKAIDASGGLAFGALERQAYGAEAWETCGFAQEGAAWADKTLFAPDANVQKDARWRATFRATEAMTLRQVTLEARTHNAGGGAQTSSRTARFALAVGAHTVAATVTLGTRPEEVVLTFPEAVRVAEGTPVTLICERASETLGCYFAVARMGLSSAEVTWRADAVSHTLGSLPCDGAFSLLLDLEVGEPLEEGDLFSLTGGGNGDSRKGFFLAVEGGNLVAQVAGKNGERVTLRRNGGATPLAEGFAPGHVRVAFVNPSTTGTSVAPRAVATDGAVVSGTNFNFDNTASASGAWVANAPFEAWAFAPEVTAIEVAVGTAWTESEMAAKVAIPLVLDVVGEVTWPEKAPTEVRFLGGTLAIPEGVTLSRLNLAEDSGAGMLRVFGALRGKDTGEPALTAFPLPPGVEVALEPGAALLMDGRLAAPVTVTGAATLGAATEAGVLTLDALTLGAGAAPSGVRGCIEVYRCRGFGVAEGAALRRWDCRGERLRLR